MSYGASGAAAAAIAQATKASGAIVRVEREEFEKLLSREKSPLVVYAQGGLFATNHQYLLAYRGLVFFTKASSPIYLPAAAEVIMAKRIWIPA